jgi:hypothetical protein
MCIYQHVDIRRQHGLRLKYYKQGIIVTIKSILDASGRSSGKFFMNESEMHGIGGLNGILKQSGIAV